MLMAFVQSAKSMHFSVRYVAVLYEEHIRGVYHVIMEDIFNVTKLGLNNRICAPLDVVVSAS